MSLWDCLHQGGDPHLQHQTALRVRKKATTGEGTVVHASFTYRQLSETCHTLAKALYTARALWLDDQQPRDDATRTTPWPYDQGVWVTVMANGDTAIAAFFAVTGRLGDAVAPINPKLTVSEVQASLEHFLRLHRPAAPGSVGMKGMAPVLRGVLVEGGAQAASTRDTVQRAVRRLGTHTVPIFVLDLHAEVTVTPGLPLQSTAMSHPEVTVTPGLPLQSTPDLATRHPSSHHGVALVLHTSGTTGAPKMVPLRHEHLLASLRNIRATYALTRHDKTLLCMPLFHVHGLIGAMGATLWSGGCVVVQQGGFSASAFRHDMQAEACTWYSAVPTLHQILLSDARAYLWGDAASNDAVQRGDAASSVVSKPFPALRFVRSCSAALPIPIEQRLRRTLGVPVVQAYAMTECAHQITANPLPRSKPGSVGVAQGTHVTVRRPDGTPCRTGEAGEVCVKGANVMDGYVLPVARADAAASAFVPGTRWFRTGDQGYMDREGYVFLTGRLKEMINRGGETLSPVVMDEALCRHGWVTEAVAFGVPDEVWGERVEACVKVRGDVVRSLCERFAKASVDVPDTPAPALPPDTDSDTAAAAAETAVAAWIEGVLRQHCRRWLARSKVPDRIHVLVREDQPIPNMTATGKIQRRRVAAAFTKKKNTDAKL